MTPSSPLARHSTGTGKLLVDVADAVAVVTINNPGKRNALSSEIRAALPGLLGALQADGDVRVVVLTGAGDKAFASGADISEFAERRTSPDARAEYDRGQEAIYAALASLEKPIIAMIRGFCLGGGPAHRRCRPTSASPPTTASSASRPPGSGSAPRFASVAALVDLVGPAWASEILFSARRFPAAEALQMGLVNRVVPAVDLRDEVMSLAQDIARNAPLTVAACKAAIREAGQPPDRRDLARVEAMSRGLLRLRGLPGGPARLCREAPARLHRALTPRCGPPATGPGRPAGLLTSPCSPRCGAEGGGCSPAVPRRREPCPGRPSIDRPASGPHPAGPGSPGRAVPGLGRGGGRTAGRGPGVGQDLARGEGEPGGLG